MRDKSHFNSKKGQELSFSEKEFPGLISDDKKIILKTESHDFKQAVLEKKEEQVSNEENIFETGWIYLYGSTTKQKDVKDEDEDENSSSINLQMYKAISFMGDRWEKNKEYDFEMMSYEVYSRIYNNPDRVYDSDAEHEEDENEMYVYDEYEEDF
jgi:hypothetical protein